MHKIFSIVSVLLAIMTFVKTTPFGEVLKNVLLILMKLMSMAQFCILMQENALLMKNINTKVKTAQQTLVEYI